MWSREKYKIDPLYILCEVRKKPLLLSISGGAPVYSSHITGARVRRVTIVMKSLNLNCVAYFGDKHSSLKI